MWAFLYYMPFIFITVSPTFHFDLVFLTTFCASLFLLSFFPQDDLVESSSDEDESGLPDEKKTVLDVEDLGNIMNSVKKAKVRLPPPTC